MFRAAGATAAVATAFAVSVLGAHTATAAGGAGAPGGEAEVVALDDGWRFGPAGHGACPSREDQARWDSIELPHSWNDVDTHDDEVGYRRMRACYRRDLTLPAAGGERFRQVHFLGSYGRTRVWLDGRPIGASRDGFVGFRVPIPADVPAGRHVLDVEVSNEHDPEVLPARPEPDFNLYGGLYREATLESLPLVHLVRDGHWPEPRPHPDGSQTVAFHAQILNAGPVGRDARLSAALIDPDGVMVASGQVALLALAPGEPREVVVELGPVTRPRLWSPASPERYEVRATLESDTGRDRIAEATGLRTFHFDAERGFFLNGAHLELRGANRHQDAPGLGNALPAADQERDVRALVDMGATFVRTSHYPVHPAFLDACDRLGLLVLEEIATWKTVGGEEFDRAALEMMAAMVRRDRHHPSIVLWGMMNEARDAALFRQLADLVASLDPTRPVTYAENRFEDALEDGSAAIPDVIGLNYHPERYEERRSALPGGRFLFTEHTNVSRTIRGRWPVELRQVRDIGEALDGFARSPSLAGHALWSFRDYGTEREEKPDRTIHGSGVVDAWGIPKAAYRYLRVRWHERPSFALLTPPFAGAGGAPWSVPIASTCQDLEVVEPAGAQIASGEEPDGLVVFHVPAAPKRLRVTARCDGEQRTIAWEAPGPAARITLEADPAALGEGRLARVLVRVEDAAGRVVSDFEGPVTLVAGGPGRVLSPGHGTSLDVHAGLAASYVRRTGAGRVLVVATRPGLESDVLRLE